MCLHGFMDTWRTWELVLPALERRHEVLALTLPGHAGGPRLHGPVDGAALADEVESALDAAGFVTAHLAGSSLGGWLALVLAARGRARSVVALAPAGGWPPGTTFARELFQRQLELYEQLRQLAAHADVIAADADGRRRVTALLTSRSEHLPEELVAHLIIGAARCDAKRLVSGALDTSWDLPAGRICCPVRIIWGSADELLPWPSAAANFERSLPHADWALLEGVAHYPQLDDPLVTAELILGLTAR